MTYLSSAPAPQFPLLPLPPHHQSKSSKLPLFYANTFAGITIIIFAVFTSMIFRWCANHRRHMPPQLSPTVLEPSSPSRSSYHPNMQIARTFKYKREQGLGQDGSYDYECPVCLSPFEDGEEVRQLQRCKHSFHAPCIDMWLQSHFDCPVCRGPARPRLLWLQFAEDRSIGEF